jgi:hypothetical protein
VFFNVGVNVNVYFASCGCFVSMFHGNIMFICFYI